MVIVSESIRELKELEKCNRVACFAHLNSCEWQCNVNYVTRVASRQVKLFPVVS